MAPRDRKLTTRSKPKPVAKPPEAETKHITKTQRERNLCKNRLDILEQEESLSNEDRFTRMERCALLEAYDKLGFQVFQDMNLLQTFLPNRSERDLKGLMERLKLGLQQEASSDSNDKMSELDGWSRLCQGLMDNFAKDKRVNLDVALADALLIIAHERELSEQESVNPVDGANTDVVNADKPNYPELLRSFSQLLTGKFPNNMTPSNARISRRLFEHITTLAESINLDQIESRIDSGSWLRQSTEERRRRQEMAQLGLMELERELKKCPTLKDLENEKIEALCLELPKINRISELMNPLRIDKSFLGDLITP